MILVTLEKDGKRQTMEYSESYMRPKMQPIKVYQDMGYKVIRIVGKFGARA